MGKSSAQVQEAEGKGCTQEQPEWPQLKNNLLFQLVCFSSVSPRMARG